VDRFRDELRQSALYRDVTSTDVNELAELYEVELLAIFDHTSNAHFNTPS